MFGVFGMIAMIGSARSVGTSRPHRLPGLVEPFESAGIDGIPGLAPRLMPGLPGFVGLAYMLLITRVALLGSFAFFCLVYDICLKIMCLTVFSM